MKINSLSSYSANYQQKVQTNKQNSIAFEKKIQHNKALQTYFWNDLSFETRRGIAAGTIAILILVMSCIGKNNHNNTVQTKQTEQPTQKIINTNTDTNNISMIVSSAEHVKGRSTVIQNKQTLWNIAKSECNNIYGKENYTNDDLNDKIHHLAKMNYIQRGNKNAYLVQEGDIIVIQEEGDLCDVIIDGKASKCFLNKKGEAWTMQESKNEQDVKNIKIIYMNKATLIKNPDASISLTGKITKDPRYLDLQVIFPKCRHEQNKLFLFNE